MYYLKNIKVYSRLSEETEAFNATLYCGAKKVAECSNNGQGGDNRIDFKSKTDEKDFYEFTKTLPSVDTEFGSMVQDGDFFISNLVSAYLKKQDQEKAIKKFVKKGFGIVISLTEDKSNSSLIIGCKNQAQVEEAKLEYPQHILEVLHNVEISPEELLKESHNKYIKKMSKKNKIIVYVENRSENISRYCGMNNISTLKLVEAKYPTASIKVIYQVA